MHIIVSNFTGMWLNFAERKRHLKSTYSTEDGMMNSIYMYDLIRTDEDAKGSKIKWKSTV